MNKALYKITVGFDEESRAIDNFSSHFVIGETATDAVGKLKLRRGEYIAEVHLIGRATQ